MTLDAVSLSLSGVFEAGQAYVALSRARALTSVTLTDASFDARSVRAHPAAVSFYEALEAQEKGRKARALARTEARAQAHAKVTAQAQAQARMGAHAKAMAPSKAMAQAQSKPRTPPRPPSVSIVATVTAAKAVVAAPQPHMRAQPPSVSGFQAAAVVSSAASKAPPSTAFSLSAFFHPNRRARPVASPPPKDGKFSRCAISPTIASPPHKWSRTIDAGL